MLLAGCAVEVEQHEPRLGVLRTRAAVAGQPRERLLALLEVGVGEGDHRLVELGVVADLAVGDRECLAELLGLRHVEPSGATAGARGAACGAGAGAGAGGAGAGTSVLDPAAVLGRDGRRTQLGDVERRRLRRRVVELGRAARGVRVAVADHLLLDLVDLGLDAGVLARRRFGGARLGVVDARGAAERGELLAREAFAAHLAQHVEFALADEVVAALALDHRLELALGVIAFARLVVLGVEVGPLRRRIGHELDHLAKEARRVFGFRHRELVLSGAAATDAWPGPRRGVAARPPT